MKAYYSIGMSGESWRNSLLVHVAYPQILGTNGLIVVGATLQVYYLTFLKQLTILKRIACMQTNKIKTIAPQQILF